MSKLLDNTEFLKKLKQTNKHYGDIAVLSEYQGRNKSIDCRCLKCGFVWDTSAESLLEGHGCPKCGNTMKITQEEFEVKVLSSNSNFIVVGEYINARTAVNCKCIVCGHIDKYMPSSLYRGCRCKKCNKMYRRNQQEFVDEMSILNSNIEVLGQFENTSKKIEVRCKICGYEWSPRAGNLLAGHGCPQCGNTLLKTQEEFIRELNKINPYVEPNEKYVNENTKIKCKCSICGSIWSASPVKLLKGSGCKICSERKKTSFAEQSIYYYVSSIFPDAINRYKENKTKISELDIYIPSIKVGIEYDGSFWHDKKSQRDYDKYEACKKANIKLIRIREKEPSSQIADKIIIRKGINNKSLQNAIIDLLDYLNVDCDVNVERDSLKIRESYYIRLKDKSLQSQNPEIAKLWHPTKNGGITPEHVTANTRDCYWWLCENGHESYASVFNRVSGVKCKKCIIQEYKAKNRIIDDNFRNRVYSKNSEIEIIGDRFSDDDRIEIRCLKCGNIWSPKRERILAGVKCKKCASALCSKKLTKSDESFKEELKKKQSSLIALSSYTNAHESLLFKCLDCGCEFFGIPTDVLRGKKHCPTCIKENRRKKTTKTTVAFIKELQKINTQVIVLGEYKRADKPIECICRTCGHKWKPIAANLLNGTKCPICSKVEANKKRTKSDEQFQKEVKEKNPYVTPIGKYEGANNKILFKCNICGMEYETKPSVVLQGKIHRPCSFKKTTK